MRITSVSMYCCSPVVNADQSFSLPAIVAFLISSSPLSAAVSLPWRCDGGACSLAATALCNARSPFDHLFQAFACCAPGSLKMLGDQQQLQIAARPSEKICTRPSEEEESRSTAAASAASTTCRSSASALASCSRSLCSLALTPSSRRRTLFPALPLDSRSLRGLRNSPLPLCLLL